MGTSNFYVFLMLIANFTFTTTEWTVGEERCDDASNNKTEPSIYIGITSCKYFLDIMQSTSQPYPADLLRILQSDRCVYVGLTIKMCCPSEGTTVIPVNPSKIEPDVAGVRSNSVNGRVSQFPVNTTVDPDSAVLTRVGPNPADVNDDTNVTEHPKLNLLPQACGILEPDTKIIGGKLTSLAEYPWMALLCYRTGSIIDFHCGGSIINEKYILTAAHCVTKLGKRELIGIRLGEHNITSVKDCEMNGLGNEVCAEPVQDYPIESIIFHPDFNQTTMHNDIAIIRISGTINFAPDNVKPICLPTTKPRRDVKLVNQKLTVTGWGATETGTSSPVLLQARIPVQDQAECARVWNDQVPIWPKQICAGGINDTDTCSGDSGGPLQFMFDYNADVRYVQYGIVSFGPFQCGLLPVVYTSVVQYNKWILDNMEI